MSVLSYHFCVGIYSDIRGALRRVRYGFEGCVTAQKSVYALLQKSVTEVQISP